jgi:predicted AAA+ superfamily ATPase
MPSISVSYIENRAERLGGRVTGIAVCLFEGRVYSELENLAAWYNRIFRIIKARNIVRKKELVGKITIQLDVDTVLLRNYFHIGGTNEYTTADCNRKKQKNSPSSPDQGTDRAFDTRRRTA